VYQAIFLLHPVSSAPTPSLSPGTVPPGSSQIPSAVVIGAVIGAVATVAAQLIATVVGNYRSYRFLLGLLRQEVSDISNQVRLRKTHPDAIAPLYGPLPTKAWETLVTSRQRRYMRKNPFKALSSLYQAVTFANAHVHLIPMAIQISNLANDGSVRDAFRAEQIRLTKKPLCAIEVALPEAYRSLQLPDNLPTLAPRLQAGAHGHQ
jgi:hypothetical protein